MCGRFTQRRSAADLVERFSISTVFTDHLRARYNIAPSQDVPVICVRDEQRVLDEMKWGLVPSWAKDPAVGNRMINARAETVAEKPAYRSAVRHRRCLVPADGFYEWRKDAGGKTPMFIHLKDDAPFAFAGLYEHWESPEGSPLRTFTIITTEANKLLQPIHPRMPVILRPDDETAWLDPDVEDPAKVTGLLRAYDGRKMDAYAVSRSVNSPRHDSPSLIEPIEGGEQSSQKGFFDS